MYYTGHGDLGFTTVIGGMTLPKCDPRLETLGALDEVNAHLGLVRASLPNTLYATAIIRTQHLLYRMMAEVATIAIADKDGPIYLSAADLQQLEDDLSAWERQTGGFTHLVTPGDSIAGAHLHIARAVTRRAERYAVALKLASTLDPLLLILLNRLSSWLFGCAQQFDGSAVVAAETAT